MPLNEATRIEWPYVTISKVVMYITIFRQVEAQERLQQIVNMQLEVIKMRDEIQQTMSACKYQQYLPDTAKKCQELIIQILEYTQNKIQVKMSFSTHKCGLSVTCYV